MQDKLSPWASGLVGMLAAVGTNFMLYPLDLTKVRLQGSLVHHNLSSRESTLPRAAAYRDILKLSRFRAIREVVRNTWVEGGARGFYVGLVPGLVGPTVAWGTYMVAYKWTQQNPYVAVAMGLPDRSWGANFVAGLQAGVAMTLVTNPIFVIKTRIQTSEPNSPSRTIQGALKELIRTDGVRRGLYRGLVPALPMTAHGAVHWAVFESMKTFVLQQPWHGTSQQLTYAETFAAASGSKVIAAALTYPLHVLKTCLQSHRGAKPSLTSVFTGIYRLNGIRGFYAGFLPHLMRTVPNATITMFFIEQFTQIAIRMQQQQQK